MKALGSSCQSGFADAEVPEPCDLAKIMSYHNEKTTKKDPFMGLGNSVSFFEHQVLLLTISVSSHFALGDSRAERLDSLMATPKKNRRFSSASCMASDSHIDKAGLEATA